MSFFSTARKSKEKKPSYSFSDLRVWSRIFCHVGPIRFEGKVLAIDNALITLQVSDARFSGYSVTVHGVDTAIRMPSLLRPDQYTVQILRDCVDYYEEL